MFYPEKYIMAELIMLEKGDRVSYFHMFQNPLQEMKKMLQTMNKLLKAVGFARISIDPLMICPLCAWAADKQTMFRHSCKVSVDLTKMRGRRQ
ncbi:unnamed protein product [Paramecium octaurelia]|uniref:Uncharacterized protein n=1 Tax=Paramecium octaurelia TaxID=43137 RepID=A0A8S1RU04_PAROT|nr:unnamed protein product [Paramecium octaurelia]